MSAAGTDLSIPMIEVQPLPNELNSRTVGGCIGDNHKSVVPLKAFHGMHYNLVSVYLSQKTEVSFHGRIS